MLELNFSTTWFTSISERLYLEKEVNCFLDNQIVQGTNISPNIFVPQNKQWDENKQTATIQWTIIISWMIILVFSVVHVTDNGREAGVSVEHRTSHRVTEIQVSFQTVALLL